MSRNGSGVYSLPAGNPVVTGTTISSSWANSTLSDIATALTGSVAADGQTAMTGNLQMGSNKITGLAAGTASGDALSFGQAATISALTVSGLTTGRVVYTSTGGLLASSANLLYSGTDLTVYGLTVGRGAGAVSTNTAVGASALAGTGQYNVAVGYQALDANTTGNTLVAVGHNSLGANTSGAENTAVGQGSLQTNTTGSNNSAVGVSALSSNTTGGSNTGFGQGSLFSNTTASNNTAVGYQAGYANTTGANSIFIGNNAGFTTSTGTDLIAIGSNAYRVGTASYNTAIGFYAMGQGVVTGTQNVAVGRYTLANVTSGQNNTAVGDGSLNATTTGQYNSAYGFASLGANTTGSNNAAVGWGALNANTTASNNTAVGSDALEISTGGYNTGVGAFTLNSLTTGTYNTAIGAGSGDLITTGSKNTILGNYRGNNGGLDIRTASNYIVLSDGDGNPRIYHTGSGSLSHVGGQWNIIAGNNTNNILSWDASQFYPVPDNAIKLGFPSYRWTTVYATTGSINTSDANQKQDIADLDSQEKAVAIRIKGLIKKFKFKDSVAEKGDEARIHIGAVAQEVRDAFIAEGLDPTKYALFCSDTWYEIDGKPKGEEGFYTQDTPNAVQVTQLGLRYEELLAFIIAAL